MTNIVVEGEHALVEKPVPLPVVKLLADIPGKKWWGANGVRIEATAANIRRLKESGFAFHWDDRSGELAQLRALEGLATQHEAVDYPSTKYEPAIPLMDHQRRALALSWNREVYALLFEMGLGKTATAIHNAGMLHLQGKLSGVLIFAPRGVHRQWIEEQLPQHIDAKVKWKGIVWKGTIIRSSEMIGKHLTFLALNSDAVRTAKGYQTAKEFLTIHGKKAMIIADESQDFKSWSATRTQQFLKLGDLAGYRRICSGTPITSNVLDLFTQFQFLDERILGHKYVTTFKARYCIFGQFRKVLAHKNIEELYTLIAPHSFRVTKAECLDLPPKIFVERAYEMSEKTKRHYRELKQTYMTQLDNGEIVDAANAAVCMMRLQQVLCGYLPNEDGTLSLLANDRIEALFEITQQTSGGTVIWARFVEDAHRLRRDLGEEQVAFYRGTDKERATAKQQYVNGERRFFVANPASGGTGLDGLQEVTRNVIYYSNDFNGRNRWQSEDRTHRIGTRQSVTYFDLIAERSIDRHILRVLKEKKSISDLTLDQIRMAISA